MKLYHYKSFCAEEQGMSSASLGKVKLELSYKIKQQSLSVMVRHVKDLVRYILQQPKTILLIMTVQKLALCLEQNFSSPNVDSS